MLKELLNTMREQVRARAARRVPRQPSSSSSSSSKSSCCCWRPERVP
eukprot:COSAG04_NODE_1122_length_8160_cov_5.349088_6_plen_47_part_00